MTKIMKVLVLAMLISVLNKYAITAQTNSERAKFTLNISALSTEVALGTDVDIEIKLTNTSEAPLTFEFGHHGGLPDGYQYEVRDEQGAIATKVGKRYVHSSNGDSIQLPNILPGSISKGGVQPGKSQLCSARISEVYQFDHPGKYTIQVSRKESWSPDPVYSNTITITVLPADEPSTTKQ
jgi:hypothetical protein